MKNNFKLGMTLTTGILLFVGGIIYQGQEAQVAEAAVSNGKLTILGTSDVHGQLWDWSYEDNKEVPVGLSQVSSTVNKIRKENANGVVLIDNGDMTQGTIMTDDIYNKDKFSEPNPMIKAMNYIGYDSMTLGNHEFNFGLSLIDKIQKEAEFPILAGNIYQKGTNTRFVNGTTIKEIDFDGDNQIDLKVGILGLVTPHIPKWDGAKVESLDFKPLKSEAEKSVKELEEQGADIVVASIHAGRQDTDPAAAADEVIKNVSGIDAYILGHDHSSYALKVAGPNGEVPVAGPKDTGTEMIQIDLNVEKNQDDWQVSNSEAKIVDTTTEPADEKLKDATKEYHETTEAYISAVIGKASGDFLPPQTIKGIPEAQLQPTAMISLINNVQREATGAQLAASALFKSDSALPAGDLTYSNVFDIYKYPNTLVSVNITGANLLKYMENQAAYYNTPEEDDLTISFNKDIRVYNYDIFSGIDYKIDISKGTGNRIINPTIAGKAIDPAANYSIAMNNYRYEGLLAAGIVTEAPLVSTDPETLRGLITEYIKNKKVISPETEIEKNWEVIGYNFDSDWRNAAIELVNSGKITVQNSEDGRTPNVKAITKQDVIDAGVTPVVDEIILKSNPYLFNGVRENISTRETNLGNLIGDAMLSYGQTGFTGGVSDFAVISSDNIQASIEKGQVTANNVKAVLPEEKNISQIKVRGAQVQEMFELALAADVQKDVSGSVILDDYGQPKLSVNHHFLQISNSIRMYYDTNKTATVLASNPDNTTGKNIVGDRVLAIEVYNQDSKKFEALKADKEYRMAFNDSLTSDFTTLNGEKEVGPTLTTILTNYLKTPELDLEAYDKEFANSRIISISEANYRKMLQPEEEKKNDLLLLDTTPKNNQQKPYSILPKTNEEVAAYAGIGIVLIFVSGYGLYRRNKKTV
ncbi:5'-nucleotidase C-terminal domain-containing protein [Enterococcus sp. ALS3]|uniref:5'-nucleotidase C-terminal domain-containing protein n=1 Tax=Enterococcus alishanensis TaxID=1303817 RepID=A0ABS6TDM2_9ENTE|nr:bifunctional metallophosphatase/5'-nucleotidase [Enterococcus alishanensis]MBV7390996.1 5'-nucleotidase C-terminal domain-containing protein [Enterococcus alishanensis]